MSRRFSTSNKLFFFALCAVAIFCFLALTFGREYVTNRQINQELRRLEAERAELEDRRLASIELINDLSSEEYLEGEARTKHGLAKPGETLLVIQDDERIGELELINETDNQQLSNPKKWLLYFFNQEEFQKIKQSEA